MSAFVRLREFTTARVALGCAGVSVPTKALLAFQLDHARARDAVYAELDIAAMGLAKGFRVARSAARDRAVYLRRPDLGRMLEEKSRAELADFGAAGGPVPVAYVVADGLSALAVHRHAAALLDLATAAKAGPVVVARQARVAIGDEIGELLGADLVVVLIGERPGLSAPDSLGVYLTWRPRVGRTDAERNCISNIRAEGLSYEMAAHKLVYLMTEARRRGLSGVELKEAAGSLGQGAGPGAF